MSDLSRLLDDVYRNGQEPAARQAPPPAARQAPAPAPAPAEAVAPAPAPAEPVAAESAVDEPAAEAPLPWESSTTIEEAFSDWVPGPGDDAPAAERELFELADEAPATSILDHVFTGDELAEPEVDDLAGLADAAPTQPHSELADLLCDETVMEAPAAVESHPATPIRPLAYEPPASLAEVLVDAPDALPADLLDPSTTEWPLAGFTPAPAEPAPAPAVAPPVAQHHDADRVGDEADPRDEDVQDARLSTSWRLEDDDLLPARARSRSRRR